MEKKNRQTVNNNKKERGREEEKCVKINNTRKNYTVPTMLANRLQLYTIAFNDCWNINSQFDRRVKCCTRDN